MLQKRVLPVLLINNRDLVKSINFKDYNYLGDPINAVKIFNEMMSDELFIYDITKTSSDKPNFDYLAEIVSEAFMPIGYGGGVRSLTQMEKLFRIGIEKVSLNSALKNSLSLLNEASKDFGTQSIVCTIDVQFINDTYYSVIDNEFTELETFLNKLNQVEVGEIILNCIHKDGLMSGYDINLLRNVLNLTHVPITLCGGAGSLADIKEAALNGAHGIAAGSLFVYWGDEKGILINYPHHKINQLFDQQ